MSTKPSIQRAPVKCGSIDGTMGGEECGYSFDASGPCSVAGGFSGSDMVNVVPLPGMLVTCTEP